MKLALKKIKEALETHPEVIAAYLFGSQHKARATKSSDIDIALLMDEKMGGPKTRTEIDYAMLIEEATGLNNVDVKLLNVSPPYFQYEVLKDSKVVFCRDDIRRIRYEARLTAEYLDFKPYLDYFNKRMHEHIKEGTYGPRLSVRK